MARSFHGPFTVPVRIRRHSGSVTQQFFLLDKRVTIRITTVGEGKSRTLRVDGRLAGDDVAEVIRACGDLKEPVALDLGGLQFADGRAVSVLRDLLARGVTLLGASPYIRLRLGRPATEEESP